MRIAGIELGGTKSIILLWKDGEVTQRNTFPTTSPAETLGRLHRQLAHWNGETVLDALGIASFGPFALDRASPSFGTMLPTPKQGWSGAPVTEALTEGLTCPWAVDTDVNGAALAEYRWGAGKDCSSLCYFTIGTGLGGGLLIDGRPVHGAMHPEIGHLRIRRVPGDTFAGTCPFHGDCIEGLVSGPALAARFGIDPATVNENHPRWQHVAADLSELTAAILLTTAPQRILIGGGIGSNRAFLLPMIRRKTLKALSGYLPFFTEDTARSIIREAALGSDAGPMGAIALGLAASGAGPT